MAHNSLPLHPVTPLMTQSILLSLSDCMVVGISYHQYRQKRRRKKNYKLASAGTRTQTAPLTHLTFAMYQRKQLREQ